MINPYEPPLSEPPKPKIGLFRVIRGILYPLLIPIAMIPSLASIYPSVGLEAVSSILILVLLANVTGIMAAIELIPD